MGCVVDVFTSSHDKDDLIKELGGGDIVIWTKGEHQNKKHYYDCILNTLPVTLKRDDFHSLITCVKPYGKWL